MAEADPILQQRVESLESLAEARVVEHVDELTERVVGLETERDHLATKADIARLGGNVNQLDTKIDAQSDQLNAKIDAQSEQLNAKIDAQSKHFDTKLDAQSKHFDTKLDAQSKHFDTKLDAQSLQFDTKLDAVSKQFDTKLDAQLQNFENMQTAQTEQLRREWGQQISRYTRWLIATAIGLTGVIIAAAAFIVDRLSV